MNTASRFGVALALFLGMTQFAAAIGGLHRVEEQEYIDLANNKGKFAAGEKFPDFGSVCVVGNFTHQDDWHGTGVLIAPRWVLTCAHVALLANDARQFERRLKVHFGPAGTSNHTRYEVEAIFTTMPIEDGAYDWLVGIQGIPPEKRMKADLNDIALLKLAKPVLDVRPAELFRGKPKIGTQLFLCGYGAYAPGTEADQNKWNRNGTKRAAENILDRDGAHPDGGLIAYDFDAGNDERNTLANNLLLDKELQTMLGAGASDKNPLPLEGSAYPGDSGGPAFALEDGKWKVVGICGFGTDYPLQGPVHSPQYGDVLCYTRVPSHLAWIERSMQR